MLIRVSKSRGCLLVVVWLLVFDVSRLGAYEPKKTHKLLAKHSIMLAGRDPNYSAMVPFQCQITRGVVMEDEVPRFVHHFFNPRTDLGLPRNSTARALTWAKPVSRITEEIRRFEGRGDRTPEERDRYAHSLNWGRNGTPDDMDWEGAIAAYSYSAASRKRAYEALGHVLHLLQDLGQPDHARNRPHPGSAEEFRSIYAAWQDHSALDRVGYELLWKLENGRWPSGNNPERLLSLDRFFVLMAQLSQQTEDRLKLPFTDEVALGLATGDIPVVNPLATELIGTAFRDNLYRFYETNLPVNPTISWPTPDRRTIAYTNLGEQLLPRVEEFGAGLLMLFYDIVNPPPYVARVEITQEGELHYEGHWEPVYSPEERLLSRDLVISRNDPLEAGVKAEIQIQFGPKLSIQPDGESVPDLPAVRCVTGQTPLVMISEEVQAVQVQLRSASGESETVTGTTRLDQWIGTFTPKQNATIAIAALDTDPHFSNRKIRGDALDSQPDSPAHAGTAEPYEWELYEPGEDTFHSFRVNADCPPASETEIQSLIDSHWGTWTGTMQFYKVSVEEYVLNTAIRARSSFDSRIEAEFRSIAAATALPASEEDLTAVVSGVSLRGGGVKGTFTGSADVEEFTYSEPPVRRRQGTQSGRLQHVYFGLVAASRPSPESGYFIGFLPDPEGTDIGQPDAIGYEGPGDLVRGETLCSGLVVEGNEHVSTGPPVGRAVRSFTSDTSWSFRFEPARPPHAALLTRRPDWGALHKTISKSLQAAGDLLIDFDEPYEAVWGIQDWIDLQFEDSRDLDREATRLWGVLENSWVRREDGGVTYQMSLRRMEQLIADFDSLKARLAERVNDQITTIARQMDEFDPAVAKTLLELLDALEFR